MCADLQDVIFELYPTATQVKYKRGDVSEGGMFDLRLSIIGDDYLLRAFYSDRVRSDVDALRSLARFICEKHGFVVPRALS